MIKCVKEGFVYRMNLKIDGSKLEYDVIGRGISDALTVLSNFSDAPNEMTVSLKKVKDLSKEPMYFSKETKFE
jgi:hypothetical protein